MILSQCLGYFTIVLWSSGIAFALFYTLKKRDLLRLPLSVETAGCDLLKHGEAAYPYEAWQEFQYQSSGGGIPPNMDSRSQDVATFQGTVTGKV